MNTVRDVVVKSKKGVSYKRLDAFCKKLERTGRARHYFRNDRNILACDSKIAGMLYRAGLVVSMSKQETVKCEETHRILDMLKATRKAVIDALKNEFTELVKDNLRPARSTWAGGKSYVEFKVTFSDEKPVARGDSKTAWSKNGKWTGYNAYRTIYINPKRHTCKNVAGVFTVVDSVTNKAYWLKNKRGFDCEFVEGSLYKSFHVEGKLTKAKIAAIQQKRNAIAKKLVEQRREEVALTRLYVSAEDSVAAGNL